MADAKEEAKKKLEAALSGDPAIVAPVQPAEPDSPYTTNEKGEAIIKQVKVYSPYKVYFDGPATSVSAANETGPFDVLPGHKNFMTLLSAGEIIVRASRGGEEHITTTNAVMHVSEDTIRVFLDV